jgi:hypothetical protein
MEFEAILGYTAGLFQKNLKRMCGFLQIASSFKNAEVCTDLFSDRKLQLINRFEEIKSPYHCTSWLPLSFMT